MAFRSLEDTTQNAPQAGGFRSLDTSQQSSQPQQNSPGFLSQIGNFGMNALKGIESPFVGLAAAPVQGIAKLFGKSDPYANNSFGGIPVSPLTPGAKAGDVLQAGATTASIATGQPEGLLARGALNAGIGTAFSAGNALSNNQPITPGGLLTGAATGAVAPELMGAAGRAVAGATNTVKEGLVNLAFNRTGKKLASDIKTGDVVLPDGSSPQNYAEKMLNNFGWYPTANAARKDMQNNILPNAGKAIGAIADSPVGDRPVDVTALVPALKLAQKPLTNYLGADDPLVQKLNILSQSNGVIPWRDALDLKQKITNTVLPPGAFTDSRISLANQRLNQASTQLANLLHQSAKDTDYSTHTMMYGLAKDTLKQLQAKAAQTHVNIGEKLGIFGSLLAAPFSGGASLGAMTAGIAAERTAQSLPVQLGIAKGLQGLQNKAINPIQQLSKNQGVAGASKSLLLRQLLTNSPSNGSPQTGTVQPPQGQ